MQAIDYIRNSDGSPMIKNGDFVKADATLQHQRSLLLAAKNEYKAVPMAGVSLRDFINEDTDPDELQSVIQSEFENDGMKISKLTLNSFTNMDIKAHYE